MKFPLCVFPDRVCFLSHSKGTATQRKIPTWFVGLRLLLNTGIHFYTERGLWILSPNASFEIALGRDFFTVSVDRRDDYGDQKTLK